MSLFTAVVIALVVWALYTVYLETTSDTFFFFSDKESVFQSVVLIYSFPCLNRKLLFNQDFPVNSEVK